MPRVLITGITGFAGSHLAERALERGHDVHGLANEPPPYRNLAAIADRAHVHACDIADAEAVRRVVDEVRPDVVLHLAAQAIPSLAARDAQATIRTNVEGTAAVVDAVRECRARFVLASTAEVYGTSVAAAAREDDPIRPPNVYAATKVAAEAIVRTLGDRATILRLANQVGPRQSPLLVASAFARQIALAEAGLAEPVIRHGRLDAKRDLIDVRDAADAYLAAAEVAGTYNVGRGAATGIDELLAMLVRLSRIPLRTELDESRVRSGDALAFSVDPARFRERAGWSARIPLERSLADLLDWWRAEAREMVHA